MRTNLEDSTLTIYLENRIDSNNAKAIEDELLGTVAAHPGVDVVLDAADLEYISSAGLRVLMKLRKQVGKRSIPVLNVSPEVYEIFETTGFNQILDVKKRLREISVEGCELIGEGGYGKVYRIDPETIAKIYSPKIGLAFVEGERATSQKAFLMGVPTAISYDVVKCGDSFGVVYELLNAKTVAQLFNEDAGRIPELVGKSAALLKELHRIVPGTGSGLPNRKEKLLAWADSFGDLLTRDEAEKMKGFIQSIPDRDTFLHGDYHSKNIMVREDGEFQLIDIGDAAIGHPIFDVAELMLAYIILPNSRGGLRSDEELRGLLGFDLSLAPKVWGVLCATYFGKTTPEEIGALTQKLMPYCVMMMAFQATSISGTDKEAVRLRVDSLIRQRFLPAIEQAQPLDF